MFAKSQPNWWDVSGVAREKLRMFGAVGAKPQVLFEFGDGTAAWNNILLHRFRMWAVIQLLCIRVTARTFR